MKCITRANIKIDDVRTALLSPFSVDSRCRDESNVNDFSMARNLIYRCELNLFFLADRLPPIALIRDDFRSTRYEISFQAHHGLLAGSGVNLIDLAARYIAVTNPAPFEREKRAAYPPTQVANVCKSGENFYNK